MGIYTFFDHTADVGMQIEADSLDDLYQTGLAGLARLLVAATDQVRSAAERVIEVADQAPDFVLFDLLSAALVLVETEHWIFVPGPVSRSKSGVVTATLRGEPIDEARHLPEHEVKAVTYHGLEVEETSPGHWRGQVIFDI